MPMARITRPSEPTQTFMPHWLPHPSQSVQRFSPPPPSAASSACAFSQAPYPMKPASPPSAIAPALPARKLRLVIALCDISNSSL